MWTLFDSETVTLCGRCLIQRLLREHLCHLIAGSGNAFEEEAYFKVFQTDDD
jgi:hypothetical protein